MNVKKLIGTDKGGLIGLIILLIPATMVIIELIHGPHTQEELRRPICYIIPIIGVIATLASAWLIFTSPYFIKFTKTYSKELKITGIIAATLAFILTTLALFLIPRDPTIEVDTGGPTITLTIIIWAITLTAWLSIKKIIKILV